MLDVLITSNHLLFFYANGKQYIFCFSTGWHDKPVDLLNMTANDISNSSHLTERSASASSN